MELNQSGCAGWGWKSRRKQVAAARWPLEGNWENAQRAVRATCEFILTDAALFLFLEFFLFLDWRTDDDDVEGDLLGAESVDALAGVGARVVDGGLFDAQSVSRRLETLPAGRHAVAVLFHSFNLISIFARFFFSVWEISNKIGRWSASESDGTS